MHSTGSMFNITTKLQKQWVRSYATKTITYSTGPHEFKELHGNRAEFYKINGHPGGSKEHPQIQGVRSPHRAPFRALTPPPPGNGRNPHD